MTIREHEFGRLHESTIEIWNNLAMSYADVHMFSQAAEILQECLMCAMRQLGEDHPEYMNILGNLGAVKKACGDIEGGKADLMHALDGIRKAGYHSSHVWIAKFTEHLDSNDLWSSMPPLQRKPGLTKKILNCGNFHQRAFNACLTGC